MQYGLSGVCALTNLRCLPLLIYLHESSFPTFPNTLGVNTAFGLLFSYVVASFAVTGLPELITFCLQRSCTARHPFLLPSWQLQQTSHSVSSTLRASKRQHIGPHSYYQLCSLLVHGLQSQILLQFAKKTDFIDWEEMSLGRLSASRRSYRSSL